MDDLDNDVKKLAAADCDEKVAQVMAANSAFLRNWVSKMPT